MLKLNSELRAQAREALRGKWPMAAVAALIYSAIAGGLSAIPVIGGLCSLFVGLPVAYGFTIVMLGVCRGKDIDFGVLVRRLPGLWTYFCNYVASGCLYNFVVTVAGYTGYH